MPRFSFPVPRRRQKQAPASVISPPLNKVQKFLGAAEINVDAHTGRGPASTTNWDARSGSCISISLSESSVGHDGSGPDGALSSLAEDRVVCSTTHCQPLHDEESGVFPRNQNGLRFGEADVVLNTPHERSITDASSLRRQQSSSTITSYYDKSKVPLVISQQTSSSAIAKGLPQKASSLLDIDGTLANIDKKKSRPSKLDLSLLLPHRKLSNPSLSVSSSEKGLVLGTDLITTSPSFLSVSPLEYVARPKSRLRSERKPQKHSVRGSIRRNLTNRLSPNQNESKHQGISEQEASGLQSLYEHYEQMSFRDATVPEDSVPITAVPEIVREDWNSVRNVLGETAGAHISRDYQVATRSSATSSIWEGDEACVASMPRADGDGTPGRCSPADCSESISSRHTRTSKASRQTSRSLLDADLRQTSVLSLSSDSEDETFGANQKTSITAPRKSPPTRDGTQISEYRRPATSRSSSSAKRHGIRAGNTIAKYDQAGHMLSIPGSSSSFVKRQPQTANLPRKNAAAVPTNNITNPAAILPRSSSCTSRASATASATTDSPSISLVQLSYTVHEARAITLVPAQGYTMSKQDGNSSRDQTTPPLSPMSVEFYLRSGHISEPEFDQSSVRSSRSFGTAGSCRSGNTTYRHVMSVTRQEELLLAALRRKRTKMRETSNIEFELRQSKELACPPTAPRQLRRRSSNSALELQTARSKSADSSYTSSKGPPLHFGDGSTLGSQSVGTYDGERSSVNDMTEFDDGCSGSVESYDSYLFQTPADQSPIGPPVVGRHDNRVLHTSVVGGRTGTKLHRQALDDMQLQGRLHPLDDSIDVHILDERGDISLGRRGGAEEDLPGIPRPDSPIEAQMPLPRKKGVRISAVGRPGLGPGWW